MIDSAPPDDAPHDGALRHCLEHIQTHASADPPAQVCSSGMKSIVLGAQQIQLGLADVIVAGGFESMSNVPYLLPKARWGQRMGDAKMVDCMVHDGLWDPYGNSHMGGFAELCAETYGIGRDAQDAHAGRTPSHARHSKPWDLKPCPPGLEAASDCQPEVEPEPAPDLHPIPTRAPQTSPTDERLRSGSLLNDTHITNNIANITQHNITSSQTSPTDERVRRGSHLPSRMRSCLSL